MALCPIFKRLLSRSKGLALTLSGKRRIIGDPTITREKRDKRAARYAGASHAASAWRQ
jgi:hypothetical protein